jgi:hypothetical protein
MALRTVVIVSWVVAAGSALAGAASAAAAPATHAPMRPLPVASDRPAASGSVFHVDAVKGDPAGDGSATRPWKTIEAAVKKLKPGDTLYLHGGTYFESVTIAAAGTAKAPITIRSAPGELAIVDAGLREFEDAPATAWEPVKDGAPGEFRSVRAFPSDKDGARATGKDGARAVGGNFADSMVPLHGYRFAQDLRSDNPYWNLPSNTEPGRGVYVGPGVWFDAQTQRIHVRLAHTKLAAQPGNYTGETDPRKVALVIGGERPALRLDRAAHVRIQDVALRGSSTRTVEIIGASHVELDGVAIHGGAPALFASATDHLRIVRSALRGTAAPWSSRASMKYRGNSPYLLIADSRGPQSRDWELAYDEFTDGHDGLVIDSVKGLQLHHSRIDNFNDDGLYLTLAPRASLPEDVRIFENIVSRVYTALAFAEAEDHSPNTIGPGIYLYRNLFDLRDGTYTWIPKDPASAPAISPSRLCGDHGAPTWEPLFFYHNTVVTAGNAWRDYYGAQLVMGTKGTKRRLFNNIFLQLDGNPGLAVPAPSDDIEAGGNLLWSLKSGPGFQGDFFAPRKARPALAAFGAGDIFADPKLAHVAGEALDVRPLGGGAVDAGVKVPPAWPDSLRGTDKGKPDIGALPLGAPMLRVGPSAAPRR